MRWADGEPTDDGDVVVAVRRSKANPSGDRPTSAAWSAAALPPSVACGRRPRRHPGDSVGGGGPAHGDSVSRRAGAARQRVMTLQAIEFLRRMLLHVLPPGFHRIRYYGCLARTRQHKLTDCRRLLHAPPPSAERTEPATTDYRDRFEALTGRSLRRCPRCQDGDMHVVDHLVNAWPGPAILDSS